MTVKTSPRHKPLILLRFSGDVSTKADGTKQRFVRRLTRNIEDALESSGMSCRLHRDRLRIFVEVETPAAVDTLHRVFGLQSLSPVQRRSWNTMADVVTEGTDIFRERVANKRFAVRARRGGDLAKIPFSSLDLERSLGHELLRHADKVDLTNPEITASAEVRPGNVYFFDRKFDGEGGLPIGVEGRALSLVSGGYDSAVASWLMLKRGVALDYLFLNLGGDKHREGVMRVMKVIADQWSYGYRPRLFEVDFMPVVTELQARVRPRYWQVVLKRLMFRAGEHLARYLRTPGIVTGEAVGQVSSQTLQNLAVTTCDTQPAVLRPLLGYNKDEIIAKARHIGTSSFSAEVDEYCAILPRNPSTHATVAAVRAEEAKLENGLIQKLVADRVVTDLRGAALPSATADELEVDHIVEGAVVLDLRSRSAYDVWHVPGSLNVDFFNALKTYRSFDRDMTYVLYCEVGQKSAHLAELLNNEGVKAFHVKNGVRHLLQSVPDLDLLGL